MYLFAGKECKKTWTGLRDSYRRNLRKRKTAGDSGTPYVKKWKYDAEMSFIQPYLKERPFIPSQDVSLSSDDDYYATAEIDDSLHQLDDNKNNTASSNNSALRASTESNSRVSEEMLKYLLDTKKDEIETLFYSLAQTVKKMTPYYQAVAKARVCSIVSELELENLAQVSNTKDNTIFANNDAAYTTMSASAPSPAASHSSINIPSTSVASPEASSSQEQSMQLNTEVNDIKPTF